MKVLYLSAWYPSPQDAMAGLFVQKHAQAVAQQGADVRVLYSNATGLAWWKEMFQQWRTLKKEWGLPQIVQMNVLDKNGILAQWLYHRYHIPYIIVEHWSGYLPANFSFRGGWHGRIMKHIARQAACILPVSQLLEGAMKDCGIKNAHWQRIHNVVDDFFYHPITPITIPKKDPKTFRFLHVSCFDEKAKNIQGMLRAIKQVATIRTDFEVIFIGTGIDYLQVTKYAQSLNLPPTIRFLGEKTPQEVAQWMQHSDCFLFFSRYENAPVVLSECLATGLPVITSKAGGIPEMITEKEGILVPVEDENALAQAMLQMMDNYSSFQAEEIQAKAEKYTYQNVGKKLIELYCQVIG